MKNSYYFPHDYHARHDPKLEKLRMEIGPAGDGIYWDLVEMLYEESGYLPLSDCQLIAKSLNTTEELVNKVVKNAKLFLIKDGKFYSESLLTRLNHINIKLKKARISGRLGGLAKAKRSASVSLAIKESKVKERKVKERKVKDIKIRYLEFVLLTPEEYIKLITEFGKQGADDYIVRLNDYIGSKGVKYKNHYYTILNWAKKDKPKEKIVLTKQQQSNLQQLVDLRKDLKNDEHSI